MYLNNTLPRRISFRQSNVSLYEQRENLSCNLNSPLVEFPREVVNITVISRTAYPQFKRYPSNKELHELYTPTEEEIKFVSSRTKSKTGLLGLMVMLKSFQRLGYFTHPELVPQPIIIHLRTCLELDYQASPIPSLRSIRYYQQAIRNYLKINPYNHRGQELAAIAISNAAEVRDHPADLINVAIEELVRQRYELPAFGTLDRLASHIRSIVNTRLFKRVVVVTCKQEALNLQTRDFLARIICK